MAGLTVYNLPTSPPVWDRVGIFYMSFCAIWTLLLTLGMAFCWLNRENPIIRVRGIVLSFTAIAFLHVYWILGQITYPIRPTMPAIAAIDVQYFSMGIYFPFGIALFQASNLRFLHVSRMQKQFTNEKFRNVGKSSVRKCSILDHFRAMQYMNKVLLLVGLGMILQFVITICMWLACAKYHPSYGIPGTEVHGAEISDQLAYMGRGWEWWPSLLWQMVWTWVAAPMLIFKAWEIRDTLGWRTQTLGCCLASFHATPMFLIASYLPAFEKVNVYFAPSQWIHVSIFIWEIFTVFIPIIEIMRLRAMNQKSTCSIAKYEPSSFSAISKEYPSSLSLDWKSSSSSTIAEKGQPISDLEEHYDDRLFTMDALEHVLKRGPAQLQEFAATSDFSGENIAFLGAVKTWKDTWSSALDESQIPNAFNQALRIYMTFISIQDADFPLNISSQSLDALKTIFEAPTRLIFGEKRVNSISPFVDDNSTPPIGHITDKMFSIPTYTGKVPTNFNIAVFDDIEDHIKWLVLTNTWPKFINTVRRRSIDTDRSSQSLTSVTTLGSQLFDRHVKPIFA